MKNLSPQVDDYIAKAPEYARPILKKIRKLFHQACPEIEETMKWSFPHFEYRGVVGSMAAFKQHVGFGFWKGKLLNDPHGLFKDVSSMTMGEFKVSDPAELPADKVLLETIREAVALNENGIKLPRKRTTVMKELEVPDYFLAALKQNKKALTTFEAFSYSKKKDYVEWITEAKQDATREKRMATALEWLAEGKDRNWKYQKR